MKNTLLFILLTLCLGSAASVRTKKVYTQVDRMPYPEYNLMSYLSTNVHYPGPALDKGISGRVIIKFIVNENGTISDCQVIKGIGGGCDNEALRVLRLMPPWKPGLHNGKPVKCYFTQPVRFKLE